MCGFSCKYIKVNKKLLSRLGEDERTGLYAKEDLTTTWLKYLKILPL